MTRHTPALDTPAFTLGEGTIERAPAGSRTLLRYTAAAKRQIDGGFEINVYAVLFDARDRFVCKRSSDRGPTVLANRAAWVHELDTVKLEQATRLVYAIEHRFDYRRKLVGGELPALAVEADGSDYWRWHVPEPRTLEDRVVRLDVTLWARGGGLEVTFGQHAKLAHADSVRTELELDLLDGDGAVQFARSCSVSQSHGTATYDDMSISMDRKAMRALRLYELRARTEARAVANLAIDALP